jgi:xylulokinase
MSALHLGIDLGTSAVKVLVQDADGRALARASRPYPTRAPKPGWAEQAPEDWWAATAAAVAEARAAAAGELRSVGLSGQLNGFVRLDADGRVLGPAVIWLDLRAEAEARELGAWAEIAPLGEAPSAICVLPKLLWFARHRAEDWGRVRRILFVKDWLLWRLTGEMRSDPSDAAASALAGPEGLGWEAGILARAGLAGEILPAIAPSVSVGGRVTAAAAAATGLPAGLPVAVGAGDVTALAVGCGLVRPGRVAITLGTAGHVVAEAPPGAAGRGRGLWRLPHARPGAALLLGLVMAGGLSLDWLRRSLAPGREAPGFAELERLAAGVPAGSDGVTFLPFLEGAATPHRRPDARGAFLGLSSAHGAAEMARAVMEGVAFNVVDCVDELARAGVSGPELRLAEGGAQSPLWCAILAAALGRPVALLAERDTSAAGAALIGRAAVEGAPIEAVAEGAARIARRFEPPADRSAMVEALGRYRGLALRLLG